MAVTKGGATCSYVLACSLYNIKPVHIISFVTDNVKCVPINNKVYSKIEKKTVDMIFHHINVIHMYSLVWY